MNEPHLQWCYRLGVVRSQSMFGVCFGQFQTSSATILACSIIGVSSAHLPGVYWKPAFIQGRRLFLHVQISRALMLYFTRSFSTYFASLGSDYYMKTSVVTGDRVHKAVRMPSIGEKLPVPTGGPQRSRWIRCCANEGWLKRLRRQVHTLYMH